MTVLSLRVVARDFEKYSENSVSSQTFTAERFKIILPGLITDYMFLYL